MESLRQRRTSLLATEKTPGVSPWEVYREFGEAKASAASGACEKSASADLLVGESLSR